MPADYNGDGLSRHILARHRTAAASRTGRCGAVNGDGTFSHGGQGYLSPLPTITPRTSSTINGDGKTDIVWDHSRQQTGESKGQRRLWLGKGDGTFIEHTNLGGKDGDDSPDTGPISATSTAMV